MDSKKMEAYKADAADLMTRSADGTWMCETHIGQTWGECDGGPDCVGPGMPWALTGKRLILDVLSEFSKTRRALGNGEG